MQPKRHGAARADAAADGQARGQQDLTSVTVKVAGTAAINNAAVRAHAWHGDMTCKALAARTILPVGERRYATLIAQLEWWSHGRRLLYVRTRCA
jgi:hypothetical protein